MLVLKMSINFIDVITIDLCCSYNQSCRRQIPLVPKSEFFADNTKRLESDDSVCVCVWSVLRIGVVKSADEILNEIPFSLTRKWAEPKLGLKSESESESESEDSKLSIGEGDAGSDECGDRLRPPDFRFPPYEKSCLSLLRPIQLDNKQSTLQ